MKPVCKECKSKQVLYRIKSKSFVCRVCGHEWVKEVKQVKSN